VRTPACALVVRLGASDLSCSVRCWCDYWPFEWRLSISDWLFSTSALVAVTVLKSSKQCLNSTLSSSQIMRANNVRTQAVVEVGPKCSSFAVLLAGFGGNDRRLPPGWLCRLVMVCSANFVYLMETTVLHHVDIFRGSLEIRETQVPEASSILV
jgi:hypothetical protein